MKKSDNRHTNLVVQHNKLINAHYNMSLLEMKIYMASLVYIKKSDIHFSEVTINVNSFFPGRTSLSGSYYKNIRNACERLSEKKLKITIQEKGKPVYGFFPLFSRIVYRPGEAEIVLKYNEEMKPYLLGLTGNFTMASILELFKLNSFYSCRIYLLMKEYKRYGERVISIKALKELLGVENKYPKFKDFEVNILRKAQSDIRKTDMAFQYNKQKSGKSIGQITFKFSNEKVPQADIHVDAPFDGRERLVEILKKNYNFSHYQIGLILNTLEDKAIFRINYNIQLQKEKITPAELVGFAYKKFENAFPRN